jgi:hypothetical protein
VTGLELVTEDPAARLWLLVLTVVWAFDAGIRWWKWQESRCPAETAEPDE